MRSRLPKVLHPVAGKPMVRLVCDALREAGCTELVVVARSEEDEVARSVREWMPEARVVAQGEPLGTAHAALAARVAAGEASRVLIANGDLPLLSADAVRTCMSHHDGSPSVLTFLSAVLDDPAGYGLVIRDGGRVRAVVEHDDLTGVSTAAGEVNVGVYAADAAWLWPALGAIEPGAQGERYLTDAIGRAAEHPEGVQAVVLSDQTAARQVNNRVDLARAERLLRDRILTRLMLGGVTLIDPANTYIDAGVTIGQDTTILPGVHLLGDTAIGSACRIGPNTVLRDMRVGDRCEIGASTLEESALADDVTVGPYCHMRPGSTLEAEVHLGNYVEVKASRIGARTQVGHFSYIGDSDVGADVNIGAGTITCNYDGVAKYRTVIGDGAFIGSDSMLVAPVNLGARARTGAGAVVTRDVPEGVMVVGVPARPFPQRTGV
jgi:bifunctional UDP-N-acetylglucosamine pyrophosphorylase/glucosamine-1-phosphate N-acetyltransferase